MRSVTLISIGAQIACLTLMAAAANLGLLTILYALQGMLSAFWPPARQRWLYAVVPSTNGTPPTPPSAGSPD